MRIHKSITVDRIIEAVKESTFGMEDNGFCVACGSEAYGVEPDAEKCKCEDCGKRAVYGAEQLLLMTVA